MRIIPLKEGTFTVDKTKQMVPFNMKEDELSDRNAGSMLVAVTPFLIITANDIILLDAGLGNVENGELQIVQTLRKHNIGAGDVTKVCMSHLHNDHSGAVSFSDERGVQALTFSNAKYYIQEKELQHALSGGGASYNAEKLKILENNPQVVLVNGDGNIDDYIYYNLTAAHSPFHQVFWVEEDNELAFFGADDAPQLGQMRKRFVAKYDFDGRKCMELREQWWETGNNNRWTFLFYHDVKTPVHKAE